MADEPVEVAAQRDVLTEVVAAERADPTAAGTRFAKPSSASHGIGVRHSVTKQRHGPVVSDLSDLEGFGLARRQHCAPGCLQRGAGRRRGQRHAVARELLKPTTIDELDPCAYRPRAAGPATPRADRTRRSRGIR